ncbi:MAG: hypothetical protein RIQ67_1741 [Pseudomonadota bacterium]
MELTEKHLAYWRALLQKTAILLAIWFVVTFVVGYFARDLSFNFFGWPFAFYMGRLFDRLRSDHLVLRPIDEPD